MHLATYRTLFPPGDWITEYRSVPPPYIDPFPLIRAFVLYCDHDDKPADPIATPRTTAPAPRNGFTTNVEMPKRTVNKPTTIAIIEDIVVSPNVM